MTTRAAITFAHRCVPALDGIVIRALLDGNVRFLPDMPHRFADMGEVRLVRPATSERWGLRLGHVSGQDCMLPLGLAGHIAMCIAARREGPK